MTGRDRIVIVVIAALAVLGAAWLLVVAPEREQAAQLDTQVSTARDQLATAESQVTSARTAQAGYSAAYTSLVKLGKAVPTGQEVPSLIVQLAQASGRKQVEFSSIEASSTSGSRSSGPVATAADTSFTQMPFTFVFNGSFFDLYHLFQQLNRFTLRTTSGGLLVSGRLLTIQSVKLTPEASSASQTASSSRLTGTITATAYVLPPSQGLTGGATAVAPAGVTQTTSSSGTSSSATTPAVIGAGQ